MKILTSSQIYLADQVTIENTGISSVDLMERAGRACTDQILSRYSGINGTFHIFCGVGNNGGDGLVIARMLLNNGFSVNTYIVRFRKGTSADFKVNFDRLAAVGGNIIEIDSMDEFPVLSDNDVVIDAIFGIGLSRTPEGLAYEVITSLNRYSAPVIAIDFPSGLFAEWHISDDTSVARADWCLTFQNPKLAFFLPENGKYLKEWRVLDIGLDQDLINTLPTKYSTVEQKHIRILKKNREKFSHKGTFGHSLLIGGSHGKIGAMILSSRAALRSGSGLVSCYIPKCGYSALQSSSPEIMVEVDDENYLQFFNFKSSPTAIGIGPGLGQHPKTKIGLVNFMKSCNHPMVIDADALNILAEYKELLELIPEGSVITPHPKEFERLAGTWNNDYERLTKQLEFSEQHKCVVVLKGAYTSIAFDNHVYFNTTGNPALATAGSGDVLTGVITGLLAQGYSCIDAAIFGVYLHGSAADHALNNMESEESFTASDGIAFLGRAFREIDR